jgi:hypothetical protein
MQNLLNEGGTKLQLCVNAQLKRALAPAVEAWAFMPMTKRHHQTAL